MKMGMRIESLKWERFGTKKNVSVSLNNQDNENG